MDESIKHKRGDIRDDGKVFWVYSKNHVSGECWLSPEKFQEYKENQKKHRHDWFVKNQEQNNQNKRNWTSTNPERKIQNDRNWRKQNIEKANASNKKWRQNNPDKCLEQQRDWSKRNPQKRREYSRDWAVRNPEKRSKILSEWRRNNPQKANSYTANRRALKRFTPIMMHRDHIKMMEVFYQQSSRVSSCTGIQHNVDHVIPLTKGGYHIPSNLQVLPKKINQKKYNKLPHELSLAA